MAEYKRKNYYFENSNAVTGWKNIDGVQYYFNADGSQGHRLLLMFLLIMEILTGTVLKLLVLTML
ncbi:MAG: hypothetical protein ACLS9K_01215 [Lachnospira eligens]